MAKKTAKRTAKKTAQKTGAKLPKKPAAKASKGAATKKLAAKSPAGKSTLSHADKIIASLIAHLRASHQHVHDFTKEFTDDTRSAQAPGNTHHAVWTYGHLTCAYAYIINKLQTMPKIDTSSWDKLYGMGSVPNADASLYPSLESARKEFDSTLTTLITAFMKHDDAMATIGDDNAWLKTPLDALIEAAKHNAWHVGQLSNLRRHLGMKPVWG